MNAILAFSLIVASLFVELGGCLADLEGFDYGTPMLIAIVAGPTILLLAIGGMGEGKLWAIKFFRAMTRAAAGIYLAIVVCGVYLYFYSRPTSGDAILAAVILILAIVQLPLFFVIYRALARVRWLDPKSLPHEWEPPIRPAGSRINRDIPVWQWVLHSVMALWWALRCFVSLIRSNWVGDWLASGSVLKEAAALIALPAPFLIIGIMLWRAIRARPRRSRPSNK